MELYQGTERRMVQRAQLTMFCPVKFPYGGRSHDAMMIGVSGGGAGFHLECQSLPLELTIGEEITFQVKTPYGDSQCTGTITWALMTDEGYDWGIRFTVLSNDEQDPLRCMIDSSF